MLEVELLSKHRRSSAIPAQRSSTRSPRRAVAVFRLNSVKSVLFVVMPARARGRRFGSFIGLQSEGRKVACDPDWLGSYPDVLDIDLT